ncbi:hypothetical protein ACI01nite_12880 [Acetobacter cibinongensis]|uniref:Glycosyl transferase n=1 Tax=Acetobacter cibinongensis TaxID=146475 RepID=A0A0D6N4L6_9PROT|nr:hypothetical protein [Acetobacter cibinongensis]GAN60655.1 hypothetical protein Abci_016_001 [Acetobacter cibinongensis]GBQ11777.1 hypothetical protein AA0482_0040 [Acetobacter cibinongensis NRIC 0482]GEL58686.1 hypothetical protein ACI01nite_12880 [Acetobacter cibinongensis]
MALTVLAKHRWVTTCPTRLVSGTEDAETVHMDGCTFERSALPLSAQTSELNGTRYLNLFSEGWKLQHFRLFNPLIFSCAFGSEEVFECLRLSFHSLLTVGGYKGDLAVITNEAGEERVRRIQQELPLKGVFSVIVLPDCHDEIDFCLARFRFFDQPFFRDRQPLIYMDADILCNAPIEPILADMVFSDRIHVTQEGVLGEGHPESDGHWYGWRMMAEAGMEFSRTQRGFSAGMIGYSHSAQAFEYAQLILQCAEGYRQKTGKHRPFIGYDQCLANYIFLKAQVLSFDGIGAAVTLHRLRSGCAPVFPSERRGLIHFLAVPFPEKLAAMKLYAAQ